MRKGNTSQLQKCLPILIMQGCTRSINNAMKMHDLAATIITGDHPLITSVVVEIVLTNEMKAKIANIVTSWI